jgi:hypothetical protein
VPGSPAAIVSHRSCAMNIDLSSRAHHATRAPFSFFLSNRDHPVTCDHPFWGRPLPVFRPGLPGVRENTDKQPVITYRDYFQAVQDFLAEHAWQALVNVSAQRLAASPDVIELEAVAVFLVKHGQYYHPSRIEVTAAGMKLNFVLNVAVSAEGLTTIQKEAATLARLNQLYPAGFLPRVYAQGEVMAECGQIVGMFLGEWFDGYHEFHVCRKEDSATPRILVWDSAGGEQLLTAEQSLELYRRMAFVLTYYYNLQTLERIGSWHHAAGDFVIRRGSAGLDVKLITVRRYATAFDLNPSRAEASLILDGLMLFLADTLLRMRLDRVDGTGEMIWSDDSAVYGGLLGFLEALAAKAPMPALPDTPLVCFLAYLSRCTRDDITELSRVIWDHYRADSCEFDVLRRGLPSHARKVYEAIRTVVG